MGIMPEDRQKNEKHTVNAADTLRQNALQQLVLALEVLARHMLLPLRGRHHGQRQSLPERARGRGKFGEISVTFRTAFGAENLSEYYGRNGT